jgi:predicted AlkP superfamily phosphohydrolase/phosphomutase
VADALRQSIDPFDESPIFRRVLTREEAFSGRFVDRGPDLIFEVSGDRYLVSPADHPEVVWRTGRARGRHRYRGIYIATGPAFRGPGGGELWIGDITPTVLHAAGCEVPEGLDGTVRREVLSPGAGPVAYRRYELERQEADRAAEETAAVRRHLEDLGYL